MYFNTHLHAYIAQRAHNLNQRICILDIPIMPPIAGINCNSNDDLYYIIPKYIL